MRLTFHGHACVRLDADDPGSATNLVIDPGSFSDVATALGGATAVLLTHEHPDHVDAAAITAALHADTDLHAWGTPGAVEALRSAEAPDDRVHTTAPGETLELGAARVTVGGGQHAVIHERIPRIENRTYLIELDRATVYHPGDSFDVPSQEVDVLLTPVSAPWLKLAEAIDYTLAASAPVVVPIHDALLSDVGHALVGRLLGTARVGGEYDFRRLQAGESFAV